MATTLRPLLRSCTFVAPLKSPISPILFQRLTPRTRTYHSTTHPPPPSPYNETESLILSTASKHIPSHGFTKEALSLGAKDAGYIDASTNLFPGGEFELVLWWLWSRRMGLKDKILEAESGRPMGVGFKVKALTWERLMDNREIIGQWQEALALMATPSSIPASLKELAALSDEIFYLSGDVSVDSSWYTKRASLSSIYAASDLFMTTDQSTEFKDTREFMERRFRDVQVLGGAVGGLGQWVGFTTQAAVNVGRSWGVRI